MWFSNWTEIGRVVLSGVVVYVLLVIMVRVSGKRTIASMNIADFVVTVALGSGIAMTILDTSLALATGVAGLGLLVLLQFSTQFAATRSSLVRRAVEAQPRLLVYRGQVLAEAMRDEHVNRSEILQAVREHGLAAVEDVHALVLEIDGEFSVIANPSRAHGETALDDIHRSGAG